ncbi:MAG TPA: hypothetical protein PK948_06770 [Gemmatimonadales bacterium]|nr:hypothetical protein [Gemmatimonadales bacterium]
MFLLLVRRSAPLLLLALSAGTAAAQTPDPATPADPGWPRYFVQMGDSITLYQPQVDAWQGNLIRFHAAAAVKSPTMGAPTYGAVTMQAVTAVNKDTRLVDLSDIAVTSARFPAAGADSGNFSAAVTLALPVTANNISLDRLELSLSVSQEQQAANAVPVRNTPPAVRFSEQQSLLVLIDGAPQFVSVTGQPVERVVNTLAFLARDGSGRLWLHVYDGFMTATELAGPWTVGKQVPSAVQSAAQAAAKSGQVDMMTGAAPNDSGPKPTLKNTTPPAIFVATSPTELVVTKGPANWVAIPGTTLLYVSNTKANLFQDTTSGLLYLLLSGRWFSAPGKAGPWTFVPGSQLPADFRQIPYDSPKENVLASVPGTQQAEEAVIESQVPQTATVFRDSATFAPTSFAGGAPQVAPIEGTPLHYVVNSVVPIIEVSASSWFGLQSGVWFSAPAVTGPWSVAIAVPSVIYSIPTSSPLHYVTYVEVYGYTSAVVYIGYTPGYYGVIVTADGTVVYGTGYAYPVTVVNNVYYPAPTTYGSGATMTYNPYAGWAFMFAAGYAIGHSDYYYGYAYHPYYGYAYNPYYGHAYGAYGGAAVYGPGGYAATTGNVYHQYGATSAVSNTSGGYNAYTGNAYAHQGEQSYNSMTGTSTAAERSGYANAYTGNYETQGAGAAYNNQTGAAAAGVHTTEGNAYTGQQVSATKGVAYNPNTGQAESVGAMGSDGNYVAHAGNNVYAEKDGQTYSSTADGWKQPTSDGGWQNANMSASQQQQMNAESNARGAGDTRSASSANYNRGYSGGGGGRRR